MEITITLCGRKATEILGEKTKQKYVSLSSKLFKANIYEGSIKYTGLQSPDSHQASVFENWFLAPQFSFPKSLFDLKSRAH